MQMGSIFQYFGVIFLIVSGIAMLGLIFFSLAKELSSSDRLIVVGVIFGGILVAFLFLLVADKLFMESFNKLELLKKVCRGYGMASIFISLFSAIAITIVARDNRPNRNVHTLLLPSCIGYVSVGYFFIWYGESLGHPHVLYWYLACGSSFVIAGIVSMVILLLDALSGHVNFYRKYLLISIIVSISLGIVMFISYFIYAPAHGAIG